MTDRQLFNLADKVKMEQVLDKNDAIAVYRLCDELSGGLKSGEKRDGPAPPGTSILYWQEQKCNCPPPETLSQLLLHGTGSSQGGSRSKTTVPDARMQVRAAVDALAAASEPATAAAAPTAAASSAAASSPPKLIQKNFCPGAGASQHGCTDCLIVFNVRDLECGTCMHVQNKQKFQSVAGKLMIYISARV